MITVINLMIDNSIDFLVSLASWLITSPVAFIFCVLGLVAYICVLIKKVVSA